MNVLVVGAGAIGGYVGAKLALAGHAVTFVGRQPLAEAVAARGLRLIEPERASEIRDCQVVTSVAAAFARPGRFDLALFTVKTYDTQAAIDELRPHVGPSVSRVDRILTLQNGVGGEEWLGEAFGREKIIAGTILNPVSIREPGVVVLEKRKGGIGLSAASTNEQRINESANEGVVSRRPPQRSGGGGRHLPSAAVELAEQIRRAGLRVLVYADYRAMKWSKLLLNLIGNATSAILDLNTMQVFSDKRIFTIEVAALREAIRVARADGIRLVDLPGYPVPLFTAAMRFLPLPLLQPVLIPFVARGRGSKMPSLHIDLSSGKCRSEIDELNGAVVRAGARLNIPTPANVLLVETFKDVQSGRAAWSEWRHRPDRLWAAFTQTERLTV